MNNQRMYGVLFLSTFAAGACNYLIAVNQTQPAWIAAIVGYGIATILLCLK